MDRSIEEMRIDVLSRVAEACMVYDLPAPMSMLMNGRTLQLRVDDDCPEQVDAWAEFLGLPTAEDTLVADKFISHQAGRWDESGGWLGWAWVKVWSAVHDQDRVAEMAALAVLGA